MIIFHNSAWWSVSSLSATTVQSLTIYTTPPQYSEWNEDGKRVSDRSSRKNGQEIMHWAASWQHRGQCCSVSSYGGQGWRTKICQM